MHSAIYRPLIRSLLATLHPQARNVMRLSRSKAKLVYSWKPFYEFLDLRPLAVRGLFSQCCGRFSISGTLATLKGNSAAIGAGTLRLILHSGLIMFISIRPRFGLARMDRHRLFVYRDDGRPLGAPIVIHAADDAEAIE